MLTTIDVRELPARLSEVLAMVSSGCEVVLTDGAVARARVVPGLHPGAMEAAPDFDAPLPEEFWAGQS